MRYGRAESLRRGFDFVIFVVIEGAGTPPRRGSEQNTVEIAIEFLINPRGTWRAGLNFRQGKRDFEPIVFIS